MPSYVRTRAYTFASPYGVKRRYTRTGYVWKGAMPYPNQPLDLFDKRIDVIGLHGPDIYFLPHHRPELFWTPYDGVVTDSFNRHTSGTTLVSTRLYAKAYQRLVGKLDTDDVMRSALGTTLAESGEAVKLMVQRLVSLRKAYQALRRGRFGDFLRALNIRPQPKHKSRWSRPKDASALWLEYWFGWAPLVSDIQATIDVLESKDLADKVYRVVGRARSEWTADEAKTTPSPSVYHWEYGKLSFEHRLRLQVDFTILNPNMYLANRLGLVNPAAVLWEIVPFSFVVDWFVKVGDWLENHTAWFGLKMTDAWATYSIRGKLHYTGTAHDAKIRTKVVAYKEFTAEQYRLKRWSFFPKPPRSLVVGYNSGIMTRAITQISLLITLFTKEGSSAPNKTRLRK